MSKHIVNRGNALLRCFKRGSAEYVYSHGLIRQRQGKKPSMAFGDIRNPRLAFQAAWDEMQRDKEGNHARQVYTREQIKDLMLSMTILILGPYYDREISAFIKAHPWTLKYLSMRFSEAEQIRDMAERDRNFVIVPVVYTEQQMELRRRMGKDKNVVYETMGGHGAQFQFRFDWVAEDRYIAVSG